MPWSSLSVVDFDYKADVMTCILPKSDVDMFGSNTLIWVFNQPGGRSPLLPKGTVNINGPMVSVSHSTRQPKIQNAKGGDSPEIKLVCIYFDHLDDKFHLVVHLLSLKCSAIILCFDSPFSNLESNDQELAQSEPGSRP